MPERSIEARVHENLDSAKENGHWDAGASVVSARTRFTLLAEDDNVADVRESCETCGAKLIAIEEEDLTTTFTIEGSAESIEAVLADFDVYPDD